MASKIAGLYDMENTLGSGHFAVVKSARHVFTGYRVAIKVIDKLKLDEVSRTHLYQEVRCMKLVTHPSIIRLYEVIDTQTKLYLIQELGDGGDLYDFIMKHPNGVKEVTARRIFRQAVSAIRYCHKLHVVHRDLKPENLVFCTGTDQSGARVKLTDFGLSRTFLPGELIESSCGSLEYSAPEILLGESYDPPKIDVWSLGVILFMLITGHSPFAYGGAGEILARIMDGKYHCPPHVSDLCRNLIETMLVVDSQRRASLEEVSGHLWLQEDAEDEIVPLPAISNVDEIPQAELEVILYRMEQGGYGTMDSILKLIKEKPYGSTAATFFLLAEAERYRKYSRSQQQTTPSRTRKSSSPFSPLGANTLPMSNGPSNFTGNTSPFRSHGSAESGVLLQRRYTAGLFHNSTTPPTVQEQDHQLPNSTPSRKYGHHTFSGSVSSHGLMSPANTFSPLSPLTPTTSPYNSYQSFSTPRAGVAGERRSLIQTPKPAFPLNVQMAEENSTSPSVPLMTPVASPHHPTHGLPVMENIDHTPYIYRARALSVFEEESETESVSELPQHQQLSSSPSHTSPSHTSPLHPSSPHLGGSPKSHSRRLNNARSSPNLFCSISKSDISDDEEDEEEDDIVELMTTSGRFPNKGGTFPRTSPSNSPLLTSRRSPTHYLTGSSDDEVCSVFESSKHRKRLHYRKRSIPRRVDSISSDDGNNQRTEPRRPNRKERLLRLRQYNSLPATPGVDSGSESLTDLLDNMRRNRSGSCRTDSSLSDGGEKTPSDGRGDKTLTEGRGDKDMTALARSMVSKFELSDEDSGGQVVMDTDGPVENGEGRVNLVMKNTTLRSVVCNIL